jgi:hypothetical protein
MDARIYAQQQRAKRARAILAAIGVAVVGGGTLAALFYSLTN